MNYIAITGPTASWLLTQARVITALHDAIIANENINEFRNADFVEGPFRMSGSPDSKLLAIWNTDYLTGTGIEQWGVIKRLSPMGLRNNPEISREVFEREIYLINQRLQGLLIDSAYHHKSYPNGAQSCMAGRGTQQRYFSVGYVEADVEIGLTRSRAIICVGPSDSYEHVSNAAIQESRFLNVLVQAANEITLPHKRRPQLDNAFESLRFEVSGCNPKKTATNADRVADAALETIPNQGDVFRTLHWKYEDWESGGSPLSAIQRRILTSDAILRNPIRIMGPGGSGKTLLMQLLAIRRLKAAESAAKSVSVFYVVHNAAMARLVRERFELLGADKYFGNIVQSLQVSTLSEYGKIQLGLEETGIIDIDAHKTKVYQLEQIGLALKQVLQSLISTIGNSPLLSQVANNGELFEVFTKLIMTEISTSIKGHGFTNDKERYVNSEKPLSRFHGILQPMERGAVFEVFRRYHQEVFESFGVLDSDDVALSLLGSMRTPIWEMKRKTVGFDFVFVDETQLFNENERRVFALLTKGMKNYVPIVLAMDEAQDIYGQSTAGFGALGIESIENESLPSNFRSTKAIVDLAFFIIQQTTDLFGPDFPNFTAANAVMEPEDHTFAAPPQIETCNLEARSFSRFISKRVRELRAMNIRQIAVICHAEQYWNELRTELLESGLPVHVLLQRGESIKPGQPLVVLSRPTYVGGQEFDAVIVVGLEQGLVPPRFHDNPALSMAVEQQALREMYLSITRARYQLWIVLNVHAKPTKVIQEAIDANLVISKDS